MNRRSLFLIVSIICAFLFLFPSCRKKGETESGESQTETAAVLETPVMAVASETPVVPDMKDADDEIFSPSPVVIEAQNTKTETVSETTTGSETEAETISNSEEAEDAIEDYPVITEEESGDDTVFEGYFSYRGIESLICVGRTSATLTIPDGASYEDILRAAGMIRGRYPLESSLVIYDITEGKVTFTYPEQTQEYLVAALEYLESEAVEYIDSIHFQHETESVKAEKAEEGASESPFFSETLSYKGYVSEVEVYTTYAVLTVPEAVSNDDIVYLAALINDEYPGEASLVTYTLGGSLLTLYYPEQSREYLLSALDILLDEAVRLIDSIEKKEVQIPPEEKAEPVVEMVEEKKESMTERADLNEETVTAGEKASDEGETAEKSPSEPSAPKAGKTEKVVRGFSIAAYVMPGYTPSFSGKGWTPLNFAAGVKVEAGLTRSLSLGLSVQYDFSRFMEAGTYLRWTFADMERVRFYSSLGFGGVFGLPDNSGNNSVFIRGGVGCEYFFTPSFSLFGEASLGWSKTLGFETGMEIGVRYSF